MSFIRSNLGQRILTAAVGVPVILFLLLFGDTWGVSIFAWVISTAMIYEFSSMTLLGARGSQWRWFLMILNAVTHFAFYWSSGKLFGLPILVGGFFAIFLAFLLDIRMYRVVGRAVDQEDAKDLMSVFFGWIYCGCLPLFLPLLRMESDGAFWLILGLVLVWANDIGGYFFGKWFGKHILFEQISPKKTWEGSVGGFLLAMIIVIGVRYYRPGVLDLLDVILLTIVVSKASQLGDLCESLIKRSVNIKDSGGLLPGHGGLLDRFDGVVFAIPALYAYLNFSRLFF